MLNQCKIISTSKLWLAGDTLTVGRMSSDSEEDIDYNPGSSKRKGNTPEGRDEVKTKAHKDQDPLMQLKSDAKKSRINAIWEQLNSKGLSADLKTGTKNVDAKGGQTNKSKSSPLEWMVNLGLAQQKSLSNVVKGSIDVCKTENSESKQDAKKIAAAAIAAAREASLTSKEGKIEVNEIRDFAGEEVKITKFVDSNSKAAEAVKRKQEMMASASSGLDRLLQQIDKKPKINVLEKSRKDWKEFKEEKQLEEELESYNKSGDKYSERLAFLQRSELREYENERDARLALQAKKQNDV